MASSQRNSLGIHAIDHFVLTVSDLRKALDFYSRILGLRIERFGKNRMALRVGRKKVNLHQQGREHAPYARRPTPGAGDFCLLTRRPIRTVIHSLRKSNVRIVAGPVRKIGAQKDLVSIYVNDPDGNLIEIANEMGS